MKFKYPFYPAHSSNYSKGRSGKTIKYFTVHHVAGKVTTLRHLWGNPDRNGSSHFFAGDNHSEQYVDTNDTAWTNGNWQSNLESITCETNGDWRFGYKDTSTLNQLSDIMYNCLKAYPALKLNYHMDVSNTSTLCPADLKHKGYALDAWNKAKNRIKVEEAAKKTTKLKTDIPDKKVILTKRANLWDMNFKTWKGARAIKSLPVGTVIDVAGVYNHELGGKYYLSKYSWDNGKNWGINVKDCKDYTPPKPKPEPKPTPEPTPEPTPTPEPPKHDDGAGTLPPLPVDPNDNDIGEILEIVRWIKNFLKEDVAGKLNKILNYLKILPAWLGSFAKKGKGRLVIEAALFEVILAGGFVTTLATQLLKLIPTDVFSDRPRTTAGVVSAVSTAIVLAQQGIPLEVWFDNLSNFTSLAVIVGGVWTLAATAYNNIIRKTESYKLK